MNARANITPPTPVRGWIGDYEATFAEPVVVNSAAEAAPLMAWGIGQLEAVNVLLEAIACAKQNDDVARVAGAIWHLTAQAETVIKAAHQAHLDSFVD
jgi:hypothetical protein